MYISSPTSEPYKKPKIVSKVRMFLGVLKGAFFFIQGKNDVRKETDGLNLGSCFMRRRFIPRVSFEDAVNIFTGGDIDKVRGL